METYGQRLLRIVAARNIAEETLGAGAGLDRSYVRVTLSREAEGKAREPRDSTIAKIARRWDVSFDWLKTGREPMTPYAGAPVPGFESHASEPQPSPPPPTSVARPNAAGLAAALRAAFSNGAFDLVDAILVSDALRLQAVRATVELAEDPASVIRQMLATAQAARLDGKPLAPEVVLARTLERLVARRPASQG